MKLTVLFSLLLFVLAQTQCMDQSDIQENQEEDLFAMLPDEMLARLRQHLLTVGNGDLALSACNRRLHAVVLGERLRERLRLLTEQAFGQSTQGLDADGNENPLRVAGRNTFDRIFQALALNPSSNDQNLQLLISLLGERFVDNLPMTTYRVGSTHLWEGLLNRLLGYVHNNEQPYLSTAWALTIAPTYNHNDFSPGTSYQLVALLTGLIVRFLLVHQVSQIPKR